MGKQNEQLLKNIEEYEKKKTQQQESKILEQRKTKGTKNQKENINVYDTK